MAAMSGSLSLGKASQVRMFGSQRHQPGWRTCSCSWWAKIHSSNLPFFQLQRQKKLLENKFPYPSSPSSHGKRCCRRGWETVNIATAVFLEGTVLGRKFTAVSRCRETQITKYLGKKKKINSILVSFIPTQCFF